MQELSRRILWLILRTLLVWTWQNSKQGLMLAEIFGKVANHELTVPAAEERLKDVPGLQLQEKT